MGFLIEQGGGGSANNIEVPKGLCRYPLLYALPSSLSSLQISKTNVRFNPPQIIQIYQDTVIETIKYDVFVSSVTDEWYIGLYKYDLPNDKYVKQCQWDMTTLSVAGIVSQTLATPITIGSGTYFVGIKSKTQNAQGFGGWHTSSDSPQILWYTGDSTMNIQSSQINGFQITVDVALTVLPAEILGSSVNYFRTNYPLYVPHLVY